MKPTKMKIEYCKQVDSDTAPWLSLTNVDELQWNGVYSLRVSNDDGSHNLPFRLGNDDTVTLVVKDHSHEGMLQSSRTIVQEITHVDRATGCISNYSRFCSMAKGKPTWSNWTSDEKNVITWNQESHIDMFTTAGIYNIIGERTNAGDGLPFANSNPGHTFHARLVVLDSSINGTEVCITQILMLSNRVGGDGNVYLRTGNAASKEELQSGNSWDLWGTLQQNIEVGQTTSLDDYIDNGIYSGVYMVSPTQLETFVLVVINNDAVAASMGEERNISQFKYALNIDGNFSYKTRTGRGEDEMDWGNWVDLGAASTTDIQDGAITAQKLSNDVREMVEKVPQVELAVAKEKKALLNGDTIVGLAREVYSRQGKTDTATFLHRSTAGGTSISDGVATLKQIGGNIVKNLVDGTFVTGWLPTGAVYAVSNGVVRCETQNIYAGLMFDLQLENGRQYYISGYMYCADSAVQIGAQSVANSRNTFSSGAWGRISYIASSDLLPRIKMTANKSGVVFYAAKPLVIDLTEMFGAGNEPSKEDCDKMFGTMDALPQGLTVANPAEFKSIGYNQWNPANVFTGKTITDNTIVDGDESIAFIECLPCKVGAGENNGYVIGYGEGDAWSDAGIEVYLTPIYPMISDGLLYAHKLEKDTATGTYVPQIKGYLLVVTPVTDKLCAHFHWSGDRAMTDYEPYIESLVSLPQIPQMSEWGLAGIGASGTFVADTINLEHMTYTTRIGCIDLGSLDWDIIDYNQCPCFRARVTGGIIHEVSTLGNSVLQGYTQKEKFANLQQIEDKVYVFNSLSHSPNTLAIRDSRYADVASFKASLDGVMFYYELETSKEYPITVKSASNYIGSDYGVEQFVGSKVPLIANILFYMRSLVSETRNFLDRLMAGLGVSDVTAVADKIVTTVIPSQTIESLNSAE